jgi:hypothetical protein
MSGPYTPAYCDDCDQYKSVHEFCNGNGVCRDCCSECTEGEACE